MRYGGGPGICLGQRLARILSAPAGPHSRCVVVYSIIAFFMAQARAKKLQISMLVAYLVLGVIGFTIAVGALWDTFPPGAIRFVHGAIVLVSVATIGLLMVQHFHRKRDAGNPPLASTGVSGQPSTTTAL